MSRGLASRAAREPLRFGFETLKPTGIVAFTAATNDLATLAGTGFLLFVPCALLLRRKVA